MARSRSAARAQVRRRGRLFDRGRRPDSAAGPGRARRSSAPGLGRSPSAVPAPASPSRARSKRRRSALPGRPSGSRVGRSILTGSLAVTRPVGADPGRIYADLAADTLDIDALPTLDSARSLIGGYDLSLSLEAKSLSVAHVGEAGIDGASLVLKLSKSGPKFALDRLALAGLGGASVEATGGVRPRRRRRQRAAQRGQARGFRRARRPASRPGPGPGARRARARSCRRPRSPSRRRADRSSAARRPCSR